MIQGDPKFAGESLKAAFEAIMRGDAAERDRLCALAEAQHKAEARSRTIERVLAVDFFVSQRGVVYPSRAIFSAAN